jgi:hypothetical protein
MFPFLLFCGGGTLVREWISIVSDMFFDYVKYGAMCT